VPTVWRYTPNRGGAREALYQRRLPRDSVGARDRSAASTVRVDVRRTGIDLTACADSEVALGVATAGQSSFSQLKLSENRRKQSSPTTRHIACNVVVNAFQQYEWFAGFATAKFERRWLILELAHPPLQGNGANSLAIHKAHLLKSGASRQEKASACNRNGAATDKHFCHDVVFKCCTDVDATWAKHLDSLLDDDWLPAGCKAMTNEVCDCAP
jgi:hypothetical protein